MDYEDIDNWLKEYENSKNTDKKNKIKNIIATSFMPLVKKIAYSLARRSNDPIEDIIQAGSIGLVKAIDSYDISSGKEFKTYASCFITGEIRHYLRDKVQMIKPPREIKELSYRINKMASIISQETGEKPTDEELAQALQMPIEKIEQANEVERRTQLVSLDQPVSFADENEQALADKVADDDYLRSAEFRETKMQLQDAMEKINPEIREIIELTFYEDLSQNQISQRLGLPVKQVALKFKIGMNELHKNLMGQ